MQKTTMSKVTDRELSLQFWSGISKDERDELWKSFKQFTFTPSTKADELTGREIETIWKQEVNKKKFKEFLDTIPDEQISVDDDMNCLPKEYFAIK